MLRERSVDTQLGEPKRRDSCAKATVEAITMTLARELGPHGIGVNAVRPEQP